MFQNKTSSCFKIIFDKVGLSFILVDKTKMSLVKQSSNCKAHHIVYAAAFAWDATSVWDIIFHAAVFSHDFLPPCLSISLFLFLQTLDYETKKSYTFKVEASNAQLDPRFLHLGPFKDSATVKVNVLDMEEPPVFTKPSYSIDVYEDTPPGTIISSVTAHDLDASSSAVR